MPLLRTYVAPFRTVYAGDYNVTSKLLPVVALTENGAEITDDQDFEVCIDTGEYDPTGLLKATLSVTFVTSTQVTRQLVHGLSLSESNLNRVPGRMMYTLFLIHPDPLSDQSYVFPQVFPTRKRKSTYKKKDVTAFAITFEAASKGDEALASLAADPLPYFQDTFANCQTYLGGRNPYS